MNKSIRAFIAIELKPEVQQALKEIQNHLKKLGADIKWVKPERIHLTLKFLGETPTDKTQEITQILRNSMASHKNFRIGLTNLGAFPKLEYPRVLWVGIGQGKNEITQIAISLEEQLEQIGFKKENRRFDPHVTLGRFRSGENRSALVKEIKQGKLKSEMTQEVNQIILFKSTLTSQGPIYEVLEKVNF